MTRIIFINLLLITGPFLFYAAYIMLDKQPETSPEFWKFIPLKKLLILGTALMAIFYATQITYGGGVKDGIFHPATVKDGKVIPGYIEPIEKPKN